MAFLPNPKSRALLFDVTRCVGCQECAKACKASHEFPGTGAETELDATTYTVVLDKGDDLEKNEIRGRIKVIPGTFDEYFVSIALQDKSPLRKPVNKALLKFMKTEEWSE